MQKQNKNMFLFLFIVGTLFSCQPVSAQIERLYESWRWAHFTTTSGLPSNIVESVIEADDSTVWVSTAKGIAWYDGYRWISVAVDSLFPQQRVRVISKYNKGKMFVVLFGSLYIGDKHGFTKVKFSPPFEKGLISSVCSLDSMSYLCTHEYDGVLTTLMMRDKIVRQYNSPPAGKLFKVESTLWLVASANKGFYRIRDNTIEKILDLPIAVRDVAENTLGESIIAIDAPKDKIGIWIYKNNMFTYSKTERNQPVRALDIANTGEVLVVYESGEIHLRQNNQWNSLEPLPREMTNIISVKYRANNDLWVTTENGLFLYKRNNNLWTKDIYSFSDKKNVVMEIFKIREGDIWIGNLEGIEVRKPNGKIKYIKNINGVKLGLVTGINQDERQHIWIACGGGAKGMFEWDGKRWIHHFGNGINIHKIRKGISGNLWFLGLGSNSADPAGYVLRDRLLLRIDSLYHLPSNRVYSFAEGRSGSIWIGTLEGLARIKNGKIKYWGHEALGENAKIFTLAVDNNDNIWFSTFSPHLGTILNNDSLIWIWKPEETYEYNQKVWDLSFDANNVLWAATTKGLYSFFNNAWSNYSNESGNFIRELRVVLPTEETIYVGGHGSGMRTIDRKNIGVPIRISLSKPIIELNTGYFSWEVDSYLNNTPSDNIKTRYKLDHDNWSDWSNVHNATFPYLSSGNHRLIVQANDSYGNIYESETPATFYIEPPLFLRTSYLIPIVILIGILAMVIFQYFKNKKTFGIYILNQRIRIANDLHDEVGSNLGSIALISQRIGRSKSVTKKMQDELSIISDTAIQTAEYLRDIVWYINPRYDNIVNLQARLREIAARMLMDTEIHFHVNDAVGNDERLVDIRRNILFMFKEILHNIIKHSEATKVDIYFDRKENSFQLLVRDNGIGFEQSSEHFGNGIRSLNKRAEEIGALLEIKTQIGKGTAISIIFAKNINI